MHLIYRLMQLGARELATIGSRLYVHTFNTPFIELDEAEAAVLQETSNVLGSTKSLVDSALEHVKARVEERRAAQTPKPEGEQASGAEGLAKGPEVYDQPGEAVGERAQEAGLSGGEAPAAVQEKPTAG